MHPCMNIRTYVRIYVPTQPHTQCSVYIPFVCLSPCFAAEPPSYLPATLPDTCDVTAQTQVWTVYTGVVCKGMGRGSRCDEVVIMGVSQDGGQV